MSGERPSPDLQARTAADERRIGRLMIGVAYVSVTILVVGVLMMLTAGIGPLDGAPPLDLGTVVDAALAFQPDGLLWIGIALVIATPIVRVVAAAIAYARAGERHMVAVAIAVLAVIVIGVVSAAVLEI
jgi:uncharacterized membrane protein